jgi:glycerol-3-phosphate cytidylyltransferase
MKKNIHKKEIVGYTTGVFDMFHIGHVNILRNAKSMCDKLIVGVSTDKLVLKNKNKMPIISFKERKKIIESCKFVDKVIAQHNIDKYEEWKGRPFDRLFVGDDWKGTKKWKNFEKKFKKVGVQIIYFPYTKGTSSTILSKILSKKIKEGN